MKAVLVADDGQVYDLEEITLVVKGLGTLKLVEDNRDIKKLRKAEEKKEKVEEKKVAELRRIEQVLLDLKKE